VLSFLHIFLTLLYELLFSLVRATCSAHVFLLDVTILIIFGEEYKV
jgi:hypothetical protein